jgi:preprotein translocase subunit YajC
MRAFLFLAAATLPALSQAAEPAAAAAAPMGSSPIASVLPLILIFFVFYFLLIKPQQRRLKEHQALLGALKKGDEVITGGGIVGKITKTDETDKITVEIAKGIEVVVLKATVSGLLNPVKAPTPEKKKAGANKNDNVVPSRNSVANDN